MTKEQAKEILAQATSMLKLTVQEHQTIQKALEILTQVDKKIPKKK